MEYLKKALLQVFPDAQESQITPETQLADIPGWDSMNAVNVLTQLEMMTGRANLQLVFASNLKVGQLLESLRAQGVNA